MLILGIDPGTARLGFGLIEVDSPQLIVKNNGHKTRGMKYVHAGCLETKMETPMGERLFFLQEELSKIFEKYKPDVMAVEQLFFGVNTKTAIAVGQARGVVLATAAKYKVPQVDYQGLSVKFALTGFGRSDKKQMQESVRVHLGMKEIIKTDDAADGLALAITHHIKTNQAPAAKGSGKTKKKLKDGAAGKR